MTTWNPSDKDADVTLSNGDLTCSIADPGNAGKTGALRGTTSKSSGKHYYEIRLDTAAANTEVFGVANSTAAVTDTTGDSNTTIFTSSGVVSAAGGLGGFFTGPTNGQYVGIALDMDNSKVYFSVNGAYINSGDPAGGTGGFTIPSGAMLPFWASSQTGGTTTATVNFGATSFNTAAPSGFSAWDAAAAGQPSSKRWGGIRFSGPAHKQNGVRRWRAPLRRYDTLFLPERKLILPARKLFRAA